MRFLPSTAGLTLAESLIAVSLAGLGIATSVGTLTKINSFASRGRNSTGAYTAVMNRIDRIESYKPFNPLHRDENGAADPEVPDELKLGLTQELHVPIYKDPTSGVVVEGTRNTLVVDATPPAYKGSQLLMYRATVWVDYTYLSKKMSFSMTTVRTTDE